VWGNDEVRKWVRDCSLYLTTLGLREVQQGEGVWIRDNEGNGWELRDRVKLKPTVTTELEENDPEPKSGTSVRAAENNPPPEPDENPDTSSELRGMLPS
jgi:hypothetical protein